MKDKLYPKVTVSLPSSGTQFRYEVQLLDGRTVRGSANSYYSADADLRDVPPVVVPRS